MLVKYQEELARPIQEAAEFFKSVERQLDSITGKQTKHFCTVVSRQVTYRIGNWCSVYARDMSLPFSSLEFGSTLLVRLLIFVALFIVYSRRR